MKKLTIIGLFRSGTNYTRTLLELNYKTMTFYDSHGWKHGIIPTFTKGSGYVYSDFPTITVIKDPLAILDSWFKYMIGHNVNFRILTTDDSFSSFIRSKIYYFNGADKIHPEYVFQNPIQMWNFIVWNHISFVKQTNGVYVRYEDLLNNPEETCSKISNKFQFERKTDKFAVPEKVTKNMVSNMKRKSEEVYFRNKTFDKKDYFNDKKYLDKFSPDDLLFVKKELDNELLDMLDYKV